MEKSNLFQLQYWIFNRIGKLWLKYINHKNINVYNNILYFYKKNNPNLTNPRSDCICYS